MEAPSHDELESLFVNNEDLDRIRAHLGRFNPIKTMGMERMEIRHSAILAWLLNPQETHRMGDKFLKAFLAEALRGRDSSSSPSALDVSQADMMDAEIRREWRHIDLLVLSPRNGWIFIIENKFDSGQHSNQLTTYMDVVTSTFSRTNSYHSIRGVFLTLWDEEPEDPRYAPIQYTSICELLEQHALSGRHPLSTEVETFLRHYLDVIQEATGMNQEQELLEKLARKLYRDHKRVLDFVVEHGKSTDFSMACDTIFREGLDYPDVMQPEGIDLELVFCHSDAQSISFLPKTWFDAFGQDDYYWHGCENWWAGFPMIMWLHLTSDGENGAGKVRLVAEVGPISDHAFRKSLIDSIRNAAKDQHLQNVGFQRGASDEGRRYSKFFKKNTVAVNDVHDQDAIITAIKKILIRFTPEINAVAEVLPQFISHGQSQISK